MVQNEVLENYGFDDHSDTTITSTITLTVTNYSSSTINCATTEERLDQIVFAEEDYMAFEASEITETTTTTVTLINSITTTATTCTKSLAEETQSNTFNHDQPFNIIGSYNDTEFLFTINGTSITLSCEPGEFSLEEGYLKVANEAVQISHDGKLVIGGEGSLGWSVVDEKLMLTTTTTKCNTTISQAVEFQVCREGNMYWVGIGSDPDCESIEAVLSQSAHQQQDETSCNNQDAGEVLKKILFQGILEDDYVTLDDTPTETPTLDFYSTTTVTKSATTTIITACSGKEEHAASPELLAADSVSLEPNLYTSVTITLTIFSTVPDVMSTPTPKPVTPTNSSKEYDPIAYLLENRSVSIKRINKTTILFYLIVHALVQMFI
ncbi:uncharacterized protein SPAPADRAFT_66706 [Spathaspora passalidarum NRRL Y-27907]|uniref:Uncharacterized protein n=1 Tax=Spathaspora passalidarum (strain NRRL Y-27907 / 11-Y1) TaxID=619300 RepID=G3AP09_SPAPN|nr:uncharacterized protein SPAPADRAFT_66706 [Spathaspora passalidarum NRRL Y-27907]EGW32040.1 hypothetical protein SPAPADRAFT_66706 [Spathaspora passalidarum NRRL Y-27907]